MSSAVATGRIGAAGPKAARRFDLGLLLAPALIFYLVFFAWPHLSVAWSSFTPGGKLSLANYLKFFEDSFFRSVLWRSIRLSLWVTVASLIVSYPISVYLSQPWRRGRALVIFAVIAPMLVSAVARSYGWIIILGPNGMLAQLLAALHLTSGPTHLLYSETGVIIALTHVFLPFMVLSIAGSLQQIDPSLARAARSLGADGLRTFLRVTLPLSMPGITAGAVIVFCLSASAFVTPALIGGSTIPVMPYLIYNQGLLLLDWSFASAVAIILLFATAALTAAYTIWSNSRQRHLRRSR